MNGGRNGRPEREASNPLSAAGASRSEMRFLDEIDAHAERVVRGEAPQGGDPALAELATFAAELRALYDRPPSEEARERHLAAIATAAGSLERTAERPRGRARALSGRRRHGFALRVAAGGLAVLAGTAGLAAAGVRPPAPLDAAFERIGISSGGDGEAASPAAEDALPAAKSRGLERRTRPTPDRSLDRARTRASRSKGARGRGAERRSESGTVNSAPGQATADGVQGGAAPPQSPGRSDASPPQDPGPPSSPGSQGKGQGTGEGQGQSQGQGGGIPPPQAGGGNEEMKGPPADKGGGAGAGKGPPPDKGKAG